MSVEDGDWVCLHRKIFRNAVRSDPWLFMLFCYCICEANWKDGCFKLRTVKRGQFAASHGRIAEDLGASRLKVLRGLKKLQELGLVQTETVNNQFTLITVCKYRLYQDVSGNGRTPPEHPVNTPRTPPEHPLNTIEQGKPREQGEQTKSKRFVPPSVEDVRAYCLKRKNGVDPEAFVDYYEARGWKFKSGQAMKSWEAAVRTWEKNKPPEGSEAQVQSDRDYREHQREKMRAKVAADKAGSIRYGNLFKEP